MDLRIALTRTVRVTLFKPLGDLTGVAVHGCEDAQMIYNHRYRQIRAFGSTPGKLFQYRLALDVRRGPESDVVFRCVNASVYDSFCSDRASGSQFRYKGG